MFRYTLILITLFVTTNDVRAQSVTASWLRQAGITCGGGLGVEAQGELDYTIFRKLKIINAEGGGTYQQSDTEKLLRQFADDEKSKTYVNYVNCLLNVMGVATAASNLPSRDVVLDSPVAVAELETIRGGQRFAMKPGETIAILNHNLVFTLNNARESGGLNRVYFTWSNSETGKGKSNAFVSQSQLIELGEHCRLTPYQITMKTKLVSFLSNC